MDKKDYTTILSVDQTPQEVFNAINNIRDWWQGEIDGNSKELNDDFTYRYGELHVSKQKIVEITPYKKVVWLVNESKINCVKNKNEWKDTKISFEISNRDSKTQVRFTHHGLVPEIECFGDCSNAWCQLIQQSLFSLITTGKGKEIF